MKNMKVKTKLLTAFIAITAITLVVGIFSIVRLNELDGEYTVAVDVHGKPLENAAHVLGSIHAVRAELRGAMLFAGEAEKVQAQRELVQGFLDTFDAEVAVFDAALVREDTRILMDEAMDAYTNKFLPAVEQCLADAESGEKDTAELAAFMASDLKPHVDLVINNINECMKIKAGMLETTSAAGDKLANDTLIILVVIIVLAFIISLGLGIYISNLISKPLKVVTAFMKKAGSTGDITLTPTDTKVMSELSQVRDEIGELVSGSASFVQHVTNTSKNLEAVADGDLTIDVHKLSEGDTMGIAMQKMVDGLNAMFGEISNATAQVTSGSKEIASGAQTLAQGSTEQAASIEELSASITDVSNKTKTNAEMADKAAKLAGAIMNNAEKGSEQMDGMMKAVKDINDAGQSISKVIKSIDDIAFQTNILALNAAVEAARAGEHGKGFAVVAEEVRNLASKSAEAAQETGMMIQNSIEKAELGTRIATDTAASLTEIVSGISENNQIVADIARSSEEQSDAITQINTGVDQVAQVVQQNSATAEESAAISEEMSAQASVLLDMVGQFRIKDNGRMGQSSYAPTKSQEPKLAISDQNSYAQMNNDGGKY